MCNKLEFPLNKYISKSQWHLCICSGKVRHEGKSRLELAVKSLEKWGSHVIKSWAMDTAGGAQQLVGWNSQ